MFLYNINLQITNINCQSQMRSQSNGPSDYKNQFLSNEANSFIEKDHEKQNASEYQKMFLMFQKMASDPNMFMKMMASSLNMRQAEPEQRKRQFQIQQHKYRNHEVSPRRNAQSPFAQKQSRKKGTDLLKRPSTQENDFVLEKYYQAPKQQNQKVQTLADSSITISSRQQHISPLEDRPIQSAYAMQNQNRPTIKGANPIKQQIPKYNDDQRPIKSAKGYNYQVQANQSVLMNNSGIHAPVDESKYRQAQQRPIKGIQGDFKAYVMKKQGLPISQHQQKQDQQNNQQQNQNAEPPKVRQFLKRGSRQHLSSAKDKSVVKQKNNTKNNQKQQLDKSINGNNLKDTNQNGERSISQNRILGRKSISSKSISKKPQQKLKTQQQKRTLQYSNTTSNYNTVNQGNRSPRIRHNDVKKKRQNSNSPTFQVQTSARPPKEPKKNIFQQSSSQQQTQPKNSRVNQFSNKTQVIAGVFLTKKQLHQILTKHSKNTPSTSNSSEVEIQQLKAKYIDLCNILAQQKNLFEAQMQKQKEEFQQYKQSEIQKIKNQRKVQQRNLMNTQKNKQREKQKQDLQNLKKTLQKQREQFRHKEKNYKIMVQKYKKLAQQKQKPNNNIQQIKVQQNNSTANKKKIKNNLRPDSISYTESQQALTNSFKGAQQNIGFNINKKQNSNSIKDTSFTKDNKDRLPNYQDLKKPNINQIKPPNNQQPTETKNKKYEYYQQLQNKKTKIAQKTTNQYYNQQQDRQQQYRSDQQDKQQIVQYNPSMKLSDLTKITLNIKMVTEDMIDNLFRYDNNPQYRKYIQITSKPRTKIHTSRNAADRKVTNVYADGGKQVIFDTGVKKQYFNNGYVIIFFANGDIKQKLTDQTVLYFYKQKQVDQITLPNKMNIYRFQNNQVQFHFEDKTVQIRHPDGTFKIV